MAKVTRVTVLCPNGRRQTLSLTPNSSILQILEEVCEKQKINSDDFDICHYNKPLDLTLPIRFANISNNALLELQPVKIARKDCHVSIALQLESGERILNNFAPSTTIWGVLEKSLNVKSDEINKDKMGEPVCIYMRQKLIGDAIKNTTLRDLGLTKGSAIIRLMYRNPDDLSDQAHVSSPLTKKEIVADTKSNIANEMECDPPTRSQTTDSKVNSIPQTLNTLKSIPDNRGLDQNPHSHKNSTHSESCQIKGIENMVEQNSVKDTSAMELSTNDAVLSESSKKDLQTDQHMELDEGHKNEVFPVEDIGAIHYVGGRHAVVYSLDDITDVKKADLPDEFFDLTVDDVRYLMEQYKKSRAELENQPLLTKELRNRQMLQKLGRFKQTVIRIYFPERLVLQAVFEAQETVQDVCNFIQNYLEDQSLNFYLYTSPPKEKKDPSKTLIESMLIPASVVYFGCESPNQPYLMSSLREKISDPRAASLAAYESRKQAVIETDDVPIEFEVPATLEENDVEDNKIPGPSYSQPSSSSSTTEKAPKWLKLSKK